MALTDATLRSLKPGPKARKVSDGKGLYIEVAPTGGKWWRLKYRIGGKEKRLSLGVYPDVSLKDARDRRDDARKLLAQRIDPSERRKADKRAAADRSANDFELVAREWFSKHSKNWAPNHSDRIMRRLERDVFPHIGKRAISEITVPELLAVVRRVEGRTLDTAHRALRSCGQILRYGIATGRCERDLSRDLKGALPAVKGNHFAATTDPKRLGAILRRWMPILELWSYVVPYVSLRWSLFDLANFEKQSGLNSTSTMGNGRSLRPKQIRPILFLSRVNLFQSCASCTL